MLNRFLPPGSRQRTVVLTAVLAGAAIVTTQVLFPGSAGEGGTPGGILFFGAVQGIVSSLTAVGIILIYRTNRIINFAQAAIGGAGAIFMYNLVTALNWPYLVAFVIGVLIGGLIGVAIDLAVVRRFFFAPRLLLTALTIGLLFALSQVAFVFARFPFFGAADRTLAERLGQEPIAAPFESFEFQFGDLPLKFGFAELFAIGIVIVALAGVAFFLYRTRTGVAVRAASENTERASLLGIPIKMMSMVVWAIAGVLSGLTIILRGTMSDFTVAAGGGTSVLLRALTAAVLARMRSIPVAVAAALGIEVMEEATRWSFSGRTELIDLGLLGVIVVGLLFQTRERLRAGETESGAWQTVDAVRPTPRELFEIRGVRVARWVLGTVILAGVLIIPWTLSTGATNQAGRIVITTIVILSLVVLTGWSGQISLGQWGLVAVGAVVGGAFTFRLGVAFWLAVPAVALFMALFSVVLGLSALRIRGLYLAVTTFAFAFAVRSVLFQERYFEWLLPERVERPRFFFVDFEDERSMYYLTVAALLVALALVTALRRTRPGRVFVGVRENEANAQAFGINLIRTRLGAFAVSGFLAGYAGVLLAHHQRAIDAELYGADQSLFLFVLAALAGVGSISGAIVAGLYVSLNTVLLQISGPVTLILSILFGGIGIFVLLYLFPNGLTSVIYALRDAALRIIAQRRQIVVPSLFADYDPTVVERQLVPLAEPSLQSGLASFPADLRYRRSSQLYEVEIATDGGRREEADALRAAAQRAGEEG